MVSGQYSGREEQCFRKNQRNMDSVVTYNNSLDDKRTIGKYTKKEVPTFFLDLTYPSMSSIVFTILRDLQDRSERSRNDSSV